MKETELRLDRGRHRVGREGKRGVWERKEREGEELNLP